MTVAATEQVARKPSFAVQNFDLLPDSARVRPAVVAKLLDCHVSTVWRKVQRGELPAPSKLGHMAGFNVGDLRKVLNARA